MADFTIAAVKVLRVGLLEPLHEFAQGRRAGFQEQVHVIRHQAVGIDPEAEFGAIKIQPCEVGSIVVVCKKSFASLIAARDDVVEQTEGKDSGTAGHANGFSKSGALRQYCKYCYV